MDSENLPGEVTAIILNEDRLFDDYLTLKFKKEKRMFSQAYYELDKIYLGFEDNIAGFGFGDQDDVTFESPWDRI
ncbi:MAG: hypothetical protein MJK18_07500 [Bdellovibrionales bacterium]|nr:hypothetical protein [Bdellovibrionales bacterium]